MISPLPRRILAGTILSLLALTPYSRGESFTATLDAPNGGGTSVFNWATPTTNPVVPWSIAGEYPGLDDTDDAVTILFREFNNVDGGGTAGVQIDLQGGTYSLGSLTLNESSTGETFGAFQNGTFNLSTITHSNAGNTVTFSSTANVNSGATPLSLTQSVGFRNLNFQGQVTGTAGVVANMTDVNGLIIFNHASYGVTGGLSMSGVGNLRFDQFAGGGSKTIDSLIFNGLGELEIDRVTGTTGFNLTVSGMTAATTSRMRLRSNDADGEFIFNGAIEISNGGGGLELSTSNQRMVARINAALNESAIPDRLRLAPHLITNSNSTNFGTIVIGAGVTTNRTGDTDFFTTGVLGDNFRGMGGKVVLNAVSGPGTGLGPGQINVGNDISVGNHLNVLANHGAGLDVDLKAFNVISGDLTGAVYTQTPTAADEVAIGTGNRIFVSGSLGLPTTAVTGGATHFLGIPANTGTFTVGDDGDAQTTGDIFKGVAFGATISSTLGGAFAGTVNTFNGTADLPVYVLGQVFGSTGTANFNTTGSVTFQGPGSMILDKPSAAGARAVNRDVIDRIGNFESQNNNIVILSDAGALSGNQTLNASFGRVDLNNAASVEAGSRIVIGELGTLGLDVAATTGSFTIGQGGMLLVSTLANMEAGATFNVTGTDAALILNGEGSVGTQLATLMPQMDIIIGGVFNVDDFDGAGIRLGPGKRLTMASTTDTSALTGGAGITTTAVAGETVYISRPTGGTLDINDPINLGAANVEIGSASQVTSIVSQGNVSRFVAAQAGGVNFDGNATAHHVTVQAGLLSFNGPGTSAFTGAMTLNNGSRVFISDDAQAELALINNTFALGGVRVNDGSNFEFEFDQQVGGINVQTPFTFSGNAANSPGGVQLTVDEEGIVTGTDSNVFHLTELRLLDGTTLAIDESGTVAVRAGVRVAGAATIIDNTTGDDFDLTSISGIDANGNVDTAGAKTLILGDTTAFADVFITTLSGTLAPNVTVQLKSASLTLPAGSTLNGKLTFEGRNAADSDLFITAGQTGSNYLQGTGQIDIAHGEDVEALIDEVDVGNPANTALVPLENVVSQQINILAGESGIVRSNRGFNANDAQDLFGTVTFGNVHLQSGSTLTLQTANSVANRVGLVLDGNATIATNDSARAYIGSLSDPGQDNSLTITTNVRLVGPASAGAIIVGGSISGTLNIHPSDAQSQQPLTGVNFPLLAGPRVLPSLSLMDALVIALGGVVNVGLDNIDDGTWSVSTGVRLSDNADLNLWAPLFVPVGKKFEGTSTNTIFMDDGSATDTGAVTIEGALAPGLAAAPAGRLTFQDGFVTMASGSTYEFDAGADALSSDLVQLTGSSSRIIFDGAWTLTLGATSAFDPTGMTFTLFDAATTIASLGTPTIVNTVPGWDISNASIVIGPNNDVFLQGVIPEPGSASMLFAGVALLGARRFRRR